MQLKEITTKFKFNEVRYLAEVKIHFSKAVQLNID